MTSCEAGGAICLGTPNQGAGSTPIRPLTAAYRAVSSDFSVSSSIYYCLGDFCASKRAFYLVIGASVIGPFAFQL